MTEERTDGEQETIEELSPHTLLGDFTRPRITACLGIAILLHILVLGGASAGFIYTALVGPAAETKTADTPSAQDGDAAATQPASAPAGGDGETAGDAPAAPGTRRPKSPIEKKITETPKPGETPDAPDDIGISIEETND